MKNKMHNVIEKIISNTELSEQLIKLKTQEEVYNFFNKIGENQITREEFNKEMKKIFSKMELSNSDLDNVSGGVIPNKLKKSTALALSLLSLGSATVSHRTEALSNPAKIKIGAAIAGIVSLGGVVLTGITLPPTIKHFVDKNKKDKTDTKKVDSKQNQNEEFTKEFIDKNKPALCFSICANINASEESATHCGKAFYESARELYKNAEPNSKERKELDYMLSTVSKKIGHNIDLNNIPNDKELAKFAKEVLAKVVDKDFPMLFIQKALKEDKNAKNSDNSSVANNLKVSNTSSKPSTPNPTANNNVRDNSEPNNAPNPDSDSSNTPHTTPNPPTGEHGLDDSKQNNKSSNNNIPEPKESSKHTETDPHSEEEQNTPLPIQSINGGINNFGGYSCYANATLQMLNCIPEIKDGSFADEDKIMKIAETIRKENNASKSISNIDTELNKFRTDVEKYKSDLTKHLREIVNKHSCSDTVFEQFKTNLYNLSKDDLDFKKFYNAFNNRIIITKGGPYFPISESYIDEKEGDVRFGEMLCSLVEDKHVPRTSNYLNTFKEEFKKCYGWNDTEEENFYKEVEEAIPKIAELNEQVREARDKQEWMNILSEKEVRSSIKDCQKSHSLKAFQNVINSINDESSTPELRGENVRKLLSDMGGDFASPGQQESQEFFLELKLPQFLIFNKTLNEVNDTNIIQNILKNNFHKGKYQVITFVRENYYADTSIKSRTSINIPTTVDVEGKKYELLAMVEHLGDRTTSGHYIAAVKGKEPGSWNICDDSVITTVSSFSDERLKEFFSNCRLLLYAPVEK